MLRRLTPCALGWPDRASRRSTAKQGTSRLASIRAAVKPANPAPAIKIGARRSVIDQFLSRYQAFDPPGGRE